MRPWPRTQRVQSTNMVQSMVSVVVISLMVWVSIPDMGTWDPLGKLKRTHKTVTVLPSRPKWAGLQTRRRFRPLVPCLRAADKCFQYLGGFPKLGVPFGGSHNKDYRIFGSRIKKHTHTHTHKTREHPKIDASKYLFAIEG